LTEIKNTYYKNKPISKKTMKKIKLRIKINKKVIYQLNLVFQSKNNQIKIKLIREVWLKQKKQFSLKIKIIKIIKIININKLND
jgi:hypothetical protein